MNSRKAARAVPATVSRLLKSNAFLKKPPPAFYPTLSYPPPPSLVRSLPSRDPEDLPRTASPAPTPYQVAKRKLDAGISLSPHDKQVLASASSTRLTRRNPPRASNTQHNRPLPIVFPEDEIRKQFFRDHPFEAYRPISLTENESVADVKGPQGLEWTALVDRSKIPTAEDAIAFAHHLHSVHSLPLPFSYRAAVTQFRTLRSEHETAVRAAMLEAKAHGARFFSEVDRGLLVEERTLSQWSNAREIQEAIAAKRPGAAGGLPIGLGGAEAAEEDQVELGEVEFTGGLAYVERFQNRAATIAEREAGGVEDAVEEARV